MKILYIHQYFKTPNEPGGTRSYWIAKKMIEDGYEVVMITTSSNPNEEKVKRVNIDGIEVVYVPNDYDNKMGFIKRLKSFLSFMLKATKLALKEKDVSIVFATSTPLTVGIPALIKKKLQKVKYVFEVRDLWPEVPIQMGALNNPILKGIALKLEKVIYKNAEHVIALSPGMEEGVLRFDFMKGKTSMVPNMSKPDIFYARDIDESKIKDFNIDLDKFNIVHFGAMGIANGLDFIIKSAIYNKEIGRDDIHFHFFGKGKVEHELIEQKKKFNLDNVHFHGAHPMDLLSHFVNACDASIVSFKNLPILKTNSPNKLFDSLSAGKPIIVNSSGWTKKMVEDNNCGFYVDPEKPEDLIKKLDVIMKDKTLMNKMGENSRRLSVEVFDKDLLSTKVLNQIKKHI
jgi:glycosyltransferase involved in cell wall biosynthesis